MAATLKVEFTTADASVTSPTWVDVTSRVRAFQTSRGRDSELSRVEAGTATVLLDNRDRLFDPVGNANIKPMNRWRLTETQSGGETVFFGYATQYVQNWPSLANTDATCTVSLVDEFMPLALAKLPLMDPPEAQSYTDVVMFDQPQGYWQFQDPLALTVVQPTAGSTILASGTQSRVPTPIIGDANVENIPVETGGTLYGARSTTIRFYSVESLDTGTPGLEVGAPGDAGGLSSFMFETWFNSSEATPASARSVMIGPEVSAGVYQYAINLTTTGKIQGIARGSGTNYTVTGATSISASTWYHVALIVDAGAVAIYLNGVSDIGGAFAGVVEPMMAGATWQLGPTTAVGGTRSYDEVAFYRYGLTASRIFAHYAAGLSRGRTFEDPGNRVNGILSAAAWTSGTGGTVQTGTRQMLPVFFHGQSPLEELRRAEDAEGVDAVLYIRKDGAIEFLADGHRTGSPWNTVQATFSDDGTGLPYTDISVDDVDSFIVNKISGSRTGGTLSSVTDTASKSTFFERPLQVSELPLVEQADVTSMLSSMLTKYSQPMTRITSLTVNTANTTVSNAVMALDLFDRVRILRTASGALPLYPGASTFPTSSTYPNGRIDQTAFIQKIEVSGTPGVPWTVKLGVSPL